jgi:hypothetical protein
VTTQETKEERDCSEGCSDDCKHKWEIEPNPYNSDFDVYVTDNDGAAGAAIVAAAELAWDECEPGQEKVIKVRHNEVQS